MANCAMCSMAGVLDTNTAMIQKMLGARGQSDDALANALGHGALAGTKQQQAVMNSMIRFVEAASRHIKTPVTGYQLGFAGHYKDRTAVAKYMGEQADGSKFCVWGCQTGEMDGFGAHWNYAQKTDKGIEFRDYQDNTSPSMPYASAKHFLAPKDARDDNGMYNSMIVLYFGAAKKLR